MWCLGVGALIPSHQPLLKSSWLEEAAAYSLAKPLHRNPHPSMTGAPNAKASLNKLTTQSDSLSPPKTSSSKSSPSSTLPGGCNCEKSASITTPIENALNAFPAIDVKTS